jgi:hypothetical protein
MKAFLNLASISLLCVLCQTPSFASTGIRGSSSNGVDSIAPFWNLAGPTTPLPRRKGTVTVSTQIVCTHQDVAAAVDSSQTNSANAGGCVSGGYTFLFQIQTTATNLTITLSNLVGFTPNTNTPATYGIAVCDNDPANPDASNTLQLCTQVAGFDISNINATVNKANKKITFTVPSVPAFPVGVGYQGQGLTLVVVTEQGTSHPVAVPKIAF